MSGALEVAAIGMRAQQLALDTIASNISNVNTAGFKRSEMRFSELVATSAGMGNGGGTALYDTVAGVVPFTAPAFAAGGELYATSSTRDVAINGSGFIELMGPAGQTLVWRGGQLKVLDDGQLATASGYPLRANITLPRDVSDFRIDPDGKVFAQSGDDLVPVQIGSITLVRLGESASIERREGGIYQVSDTAPLTELEPGESGIGTLVQGALERSNVDLNSEMVSLLISQRAYTANAQVLKAADEFFSVANSLRR
jgi:fagellar hook-basal body proteins